MRRGGAALTSVLAAAVAFPATVGLSVAPATAASAASAAPPTPEARVANAVVAIEVSDAGRTSAAAQESAARPTPGDTAELSPETFLGYALGERFTPPEAAVAYARHLAGASPRVDVVRYGTTPEGRPLILLVLGTEAHLAGLDEILARNAELTDPALPSERAAEIARANPAVVWFTYGVHGDESSSTEAALWTAYDLAAGAAAAALDSLIVVLDPVSNPDGRARYVSWYRSVRGAEPNPDPDTREHDPPWPGGRFNHYLFDLNRDWAWLTQPEARARVEAWKRWNPQVHVDFHEMSYESTYFFFPAAAPMNPVYPDYTLRWAEYFGRANAEAFDRHGWLYYTGEEFDLFYPGYGDSWPSLTGAIGMTYEQAGGGAAGLAVRRTDGTLLTLADRASHHRAAGFATLRAAARRKTELLEDFASFHRSVGTSVDAEDTGAAVGGYLLVPGPRPGAARALVRLLESQGIEVEMARAPFEASAEPHAGSESREEFPAGTYRVAVRQPRGRLARTLLRAAVPFDEDIHFSYDITAWSLPYAYGVEAYTVESGAESPDVFVPVSPADLRDSAAAGDWRAADTADAGGSRGTGAAEVPYGWLVPPAFDAAGPLYRYLDAGGRARALGDSIHLAGTDWPPGTVFVPADDSASARLARARLAALAEPVASGWTASGADLGTEDALVLTAPGIAVLAGSGLSPTSFGASWFLLERIAGIPFDALQADGVEGGALREYDVVVLPAGDPERALGTSGAAALEEWVEEGGVLVALGGSAEWAGELAGIDVRRADEADRIRDRAATADSVSAPNAAATDDDAGGPRTRERRRLEAWEEAVHGAIVEARVDPENPLAWGEEGGEVDGRLFVLHTGEFAFAPPGSRAANAAPDSAAGGETAGEGAGSGDYEAVAFFPMDVRAVSGVAGERALDRLAGAAWLATATLGDGRVILFADDPLFRLFWRSGFGLFTNALLLGPAMD